MIVESDIEITKVTRDDVTPDNPLYERLRYTNKYNATLPIDIDAYADVRIENYAEHERHVLAMIKRKVADELYGDLIEPFQQLCRLAYSAAAASYGAVSHEEMRRCVRHIDALINLESINPEVEGF